MGKYVNMSMKDLRGTVIKYKNAKDLQGPHFVRKNMLTLVSLAYSNTEVR